MADPPPVIVLAGPNGAGKSTVAPEVIASCLGVTSFVNADVIARGLAGFAPENADLAAGRLMLARLRELASQRAAFAFETTLASRTTWRVFDNSSSEKGPLLVARGGISLADTIEQSETWDQFRRTAGAAAQ
jgi:predicted ABC-type ATPase